MKTSAEIEIDLVGVSVRQELHARLATAFGFPSHYGMNWDAFWDCITSLEVMPKKIKISGIASLTVVLPRESALLKQCLADFQSRQKRPPVEVIFQ